MSDQPNPVPVPESTTTFVVEGLNVSGKWETWGVSDTGSGKSLNPCDTIEAARGIKGELDDYRLSEKTGWTDSRIVEVTTTRRVVS